MFYSTRRFVLYLTLCHFVLVFFRPISIAITSLGEERANLSVFRMFVRFHLLLGVWEGLRFVIVALPGLFCYLLCLFGFVGFLFLLVSGKGCGLWLWHSLDFSLTFFVYGLTWFVCSCCWCHWYELDWVLWLWLLLDIFYTMIYWEVQRD